MTQTHMKHTMNNVMTSTENDEKNGETEMLLKHSWNGIKWSGFRLFYTLVSILQPSIIWFVENLSIETLCITF